MKAPTLLALAGLSISAAQASDEVLSLACRGTVRLVEQPNVLPETTESISIGLVINFTARTVAGFAFPVEIETVNEGNILFGSSSSHKIVDSDWSINGTIERVTGNVSAISTTVGPKTREVVTKDFYTLQCKPTKRMF